MTMLIGAMSPRAGQGATSWLLSLAYDATRNGKVLLADLDASGMSCVADMLGLPNLGKSVANLTSVAAVSRELFLGQIVEAPECRGLDVMPGTVGSPLKSAAWMVDNLARYFRATHYDYVFMDLGQAFTYPEARDPASAADLICKQLDRLFIVINDSPESVRSCLDSLRLARPAFGDVILMRRKDNPDLSGYLNDALSTRIPGLRLASTFEWNEKQYRRAVLSGKPLDRPGQAARLLQVPEPPAVEAEPAAPVVVAAVPGIPDRPQIELTR